MVIVLFFILRSGFSMMCGIYHIIDGAFKLMYSVHCILPCKIFIIRSAYFFICGGLIVIFCAFLLRHLLSVVCRVFFIRYTLCIILAMPSFDYVQCVCRYQFLASFSLDLKRGRRKLNGHGTRNHQNHAGHLGKFGNYGSYP